MRVIMRVAEVAISVLLVGGFTAANSAEQYREEPEASQCNKNDSSTFSACTCEQLQALYDEFVRTAQYYDNLSDSASGTEEQMLDMKAAQYYGMAAKAADAKIQKNCGA